MLRTATCSCGQLAATCEGEPQRVVICSCLACQRRTGSPFGAGAYYLRTQVRTSGRTGEFRRTSDAGRWFETHFCPDCGTSLFWYLERDPAVMGVAVGGFADPGFPRPVRAVWSEHKVDWVEFPADVEQFARGRPG